MPLATQADVEQRLPISFTADPEPVVTALIAAATGHIERLYGGPVEDTDYLAEVHSPPGPLFLKHVPVNSITAIREDGAVVAATEYTFTSYGVVERLTADGFHSWWQGAFKPESIQVDYNAGFVTVPQDIRDVCAQMVVNSMKQNGMFDDATVIGAQSESIGDYSITYGELLANPTAYVQMTDEQRDVIRYYRVPALA